MASAKRIVSTSEIRQAFRDGLTPAEGVSTASLFGASGDSTKVRGRIHPAHVEVFLAANPGTKFGEGADAPAKRTVSVPRTGANGRSLKPVTLPVAEAKRLAGVEGKRGRLSSDELVAAGVAYQQANVKA